MRAILTLVCGLVLFGGKALAQNWIPTNDPTYYGPFNGVFLPDGDGLKKPLVKDDTITRADSPWTLYAWVWLDESPKGPTLIAGIGKLEDEYSRYLGIDGNKLILWAGKDNTLSGAAALTPKKWHFLTASFDGRDFHLSAEGTPVADGKLDLGSVSGVLEMAPFPLPWPEGKHFSGKIAALTVLRHALTADELKALGEKPGSFSAPASSRKPRSHGRCKLTHRRDIAGHRTPLHCRARRPRSPNPKRKPLVQQARAWKSPEKMNGYWALGNCGPPRTCWSPPKPSPIPNSRCESGGPPRSREQY